MITVSKQDREGQKSDGNQPNKEGQPIAHKPYISGPKLEPTLGPGVTPTLKKDKKRSAAYIDFTG